MAAKGKKITGMDLDEGRTPAEIAARVKLMEAEAACAEAEAESYRAEARKSDIEVTFGMENIASIKTARIIQDIQARAAVRTEQEALAAPRYHHIYHYTQQVDPRSVRACMEQIDIWHRNDEACAFEIVFSSPGGSVIDGMALFDYIQQMRAAGHYVTTSTIGMAASMAGILLQAGDRRVMGKEAYLLIHQISTVMGGSYGQLEDEMTFVKKIQTRVVAIFAQRSKMSKTAIEKAWKRKDWWLDSVEAIKLGFVDEVR